MKKFFTLLFILVAGYWLYSHCTRKTESSSPETLKQVKVMVQTANLRMGPGTSYSIAISESGAKCQVTRGTLLDVVAEKNGWYQVRIPNANNTAYIKQTLCADPSAGQGRGRRSNSGSAYSGASGGNQEAATSSEQEQAPIIESDPDEVVEEVTKGQPNDEVIF